MKQHIALCAFILCLLVPGGILSQTVFTDVTAATGLGVDGKKEGGHAWYDFDLDGDMDVLVNTHENADGSTLLRNDGGIFTDVTLLLAPFLEDDGFERSAVWGDLNQDGYPDFVRNKQDVIEVYLQDPVSGIFGDGVGGINPQSYTSSEVSDGFKPEGLGLLDYDNDGDLDMFFNNENEGNDILENAGGANFFHATPGTDGPSLGLEQHTNSGDYLCVTDYNNDGYIDATVRCTDQADLFKNLGGTFSEVQNFDQSGGNEGAVAHHDFDNDGDFDLFWTESGVNQIWRNDGAGSWVALGSSTGLPESLPGGLDGMVGGDVDNDGDIDIFLSGDSRGWLYINQLNSPTLGPGSGAANTFVLDPYDFYSADGESCSMVDYDLDGDLDLYVILDDEPNRIYRNDLTGPSVGSFVTINVFENRPESGQAAGTQRYATGATVILTDCDGNSISGIHEVNGGIGHGGQGIPAIHFGLPNGTNSDYSVRIAYPVLDGERLVYNLLLHPDDLTEPVFVVASEAIDNLAPVALDDNFVMDATVVTEFNFDPLLDNGNGVDYDPEGEALTVIGVGSASNGTVTLNENGTITYAPDFGFSGTDTFTYTIKDTPTCGSAGVTAEGTVTFDVTGVPLCANLVVQSITIDDLLCPWMTVDVTITNEGNQGTIDPVSVSLYSGNPTAAGAVLLHTTTTSASIAAGGSETISHGLTFASTFNLYAVVNDPGSLVLPIDISADFPATANTECAYSDNVGSITVDCADTDGDGIFDTVDLDDDNDGILDNDENQCFTVFNFDASSEGWYTINDNDNSQPGSIPASHSTQTVTGNDGCPIDITGPANLSIAGASPTNSNYVVDSDGNGGETYMRSPSLGGMDWSNMIDGVFRFSHYNYRVGYVGDPSWYDASNAHVLLYGTNGAMVETFPVLDTDLMEAGIWNDHIVPLNDATWSGTQADLEGVLSSIDYISIRIEFITGGNTGDCSDIEYYALDNVIAQAAGGCNDDFDGDGIPNDKDLDSDNDGIFDAVEAGHGASQVGGRLTEPVGTDGIPNSVQDIGNENSGCVNYTPSDTNGDGQINALDPDSDGDGCPDVSDAGFTDSDNDGILSSSPVNVDQNGVVTSGTDGYSALWLGYLDPTIRGCDPEVCYDGIDNNGDGQVDCDDEACYQGFTDTDGDEVADGCDLDDDNDGILDSDEYDFACSTAIAVNNGYTLNTDFSGSASGLTGLGSANGASFNFTYQLMGSATWSDGIEIRNEAAIAGDGDHLYTQPVNTSFPNGDVAEYTFTFSQSVHNLAFKCGGLDVNDRIAVQAFKDGLELGIGPLNFTNISINAADLTVTGNGVISTAAGNNLPDNAIQLSFGEAVDQVVITAGKESTSQYGNNVTLQFYEFEYCVAGDSDADGTPDYLDADSDNDGCLDVTEAGYTDTDADGYLGESPVTVDADGLVVSSPDGYTGTTPEVTDPGNTSACNTPPTAVDDVFSTPEDTATDLPVLDNDSDAESMLDLASLSVTSPPTNGAVTINPDGSINYLPNAEFNGTDAFTYEICDDGLPPFCSEATVSVTVTPVNDPPVADDEIAVLDEDQVITINVLTGDVDPDGTLGNPTISTAPSNGSVIVNPDGSITYSPNLNFNGTDSFTYSVCDDGMPVLCDEGLVSITVNPINDEPVADDETVNLDEDTTITIDVLTGDSDPDDPAGSIVPATLSIVVNPLNGTAVINPDGTIDYTPDPDYVGFDVFTYEICDDGNPLPSMCTDAVVNITVNPLNDNPDVQDDIAVTDEDVSVSINVIANDSDVDGDLNTSSLTIDTEPANGSLLVLGSGSVIYFPDDNFYGTDSFVYTICDNGTPLPATCGNALVTITVNPVNDPPLAFNDTYSTLEESMVSCPVLLNDNNIDGSLDLTTLTTFNGPANGTVVVNGDGTIDYTPNTGYSGTDSFEYEICDDGFPAPGLCATALVTINVSDEAPTAFDDNQSLLEDAVDEIIFVLDNDVDPNNNIDPSTLLLVSGPSNGTIITNADGTFAYTPNADFNGSDSFSYQICDEEGYCDGASVALTIDPVNDAPQVEYDSAPVSEDASVDIDILANDSDPLDPFGNIDPATVTITVAPANGSVTVNPDGSVTYTPDPDFTGVDSFTYQVCDDGNPLPALCGEALVDITVLPENDAPEAVDDSAATGDQTDISIDVLSNDFDIDADDLTVTEIIATGTGTVTINADGSLDYSPALGFCGTDTLTYVVCDGGMPALCDTADVFITVTPDDSDGDGLPDVLEVPGTDSDMDGIEDYLDLDSDNDSIPDSVESQFDATDPCNVTVIDSDGDGTPDHLDEDSDEDGIADIAEAGDDGNNPVDTDGDGAPDYLDQDSDGDGLSDTIEGGADPFNPTDSDGDGIGDFQEVDSDNDTIPDYVEAGDPDNPVDTDGDGTPDYQDTDSDNDTIPDQVEAGEDGENPVDTDGNGDPDYTDTDADDDTIPDEVEAGDDPWNPVDTDGDGADDYQDVDSDNDTIPDEDETGSDPTDPVDSDGDGLPDYQDPDADNDHVPDAEEYDADGDGIPDDCDNDGIINVLDPDPCGLFIPTGFSPDDDGINETWNIRGLDSYPEHEVVIINRWGNEVFKAAPYENTWDGRSNSGITIGDELLPEGTYFYIIDLKNGEKPLTGYLYLSR